MSEWLPNCLVNAAGPASDGLEAPNPPDLVTYINLTDQGGSFANKWFYAADNSKSEMLAVALTAISVQASVQVTLDPPNAANDPFTKVYRLYLNAW
jgi:hypothetical protein